MSKSTTNLGKLRDLPDDELRAALATTRDDLFRLHLGRYTNQVTSTAALTTKRRDIARMLTILNARAHGSEKQGKAAAEAPAKAPGAKKAAKATTKKAK